MLHLLKGPQCRITGLAWAKSDAILASSSTEDGTVYAWDVESGTILRIIPVEGVFGIRASACHPFVVAFGCRIRTVTVCDVEHGNSFPISTGARQAILAPNGTHLIVGSSMGKPGGLSTWDLHLLLDRRAAGLDGEALSIDTSDFSVLATSSLNGPQVRPSTPSGRMLTTLIS